MEKRAHMGQRLQSPSSILTYKQCPRKYYYRYIKKLPSQKSIHLVRGSIAHQVMEDIYGVDLLKVPDEQFLVTLKVVLQEMFNKEWTAAEKELAALGMSEAELQVYHDETRIMIHNFFHYLIDRLKLTGLPLKEAFTNEQPEREVELRSTAHSVRGFADAIHKEGDKVFILDYKTSKRAHISDDYRLQLSIYGMIYEELEKLPDEVGIFFLKHGQEMRLPMTHAMVEHARKEIHAIHDNTKSMSLTDYPMKPSPLCKWSTGQCDYYEQCFGQKSLQDY